MTAKTAISTRIWLITQYFPPEITAAAFRLGGLARFLKNEGFDVTVFTATPRASSGRGDDKALTGIQVVRIPVSARSHAGQYLQFLAGVKMHTRRLLRNGPGPEVVMASSPPMSVFPAAISLARRCRASLILDVRDLWPDTPAALGRLPATGPVYRYFRRLEQRSYRRADGIFCVSRPMAACIRAAGATTVEVMYNGVSRADLQTAVTLPAPSPRTSTAPLQVFYFGNLGLAQGLDVLVDAANILDPSAFQFHLMGNGVRRGHLENRIARERLEHVHLHPALPRKHLFPEVARRAQVLFFNLAPGRVFTRTIPSKLFDYLLLRRPIIAGVEGEAREILDRCGCALDFEKSRPEALAAALSLAAERMESLTAAALQNNIRVLGAFVREEQFARATKMIRKISAGNR